jgi:tRNA modification GTPase
VKESITIEGVPMHLIDTAGLRDTNDVVESKGIERSWDAIRLADLVIFMADIDSSDTDSRLKDKILAELPPKCPVVHVMNKSDLLPVNTLLTPEGAILISAKTGDGIPALKRKILEMVGWSGPQEGAIVARRRHLDCLERASEHIVKSEQFAANGNNSLELFAEELSLAQNHLGQITGKLLPDDLLGKIFSQFCIGK